MRQRDRPKAWAKQENLVTNRTDLALVSADPQALQQVSSLKEMEEMQLT